MNKKIIGVIAFAAIAVVAGWGYIQNKQNVVLSDLAMENVEALARYELPEVEINCGATSGACWMRNGGICFVGEYRYEKCSFVGYTYVSCTSPCK